MQLVRGARAKLHRARPAARSAVNALDPELGGAWPGRDVAEPLVELSRAVAELEAVETSCATSIAAIDFPAIGRIPERASLWRGGMPARARRGQEVYLCWLLDRGGDGGTVARAGVGVRSVDAACREHRCAGASAQRRSRPAPELGARPAVAGTARQPRGA